MYYVANTFSNPSFRPIIVEVFNDYNLAVAYVEIMNKAGKGSFTILGELCPEEQPTDEGIPQIDDDGEIIGFKRKNKPTRF